jgi:glycosyltransferase involved in cell wall biosynthesis
MIEVIICTYNGENFIEDQLISILNQSVIPDLISIFDDQSQDRTINIIESVILKSRVKINVTINKEKKGYRKNFLEAIINSKSKIVFLSDQDDVWVYSKIEIMIANLKKSKVDAVCSNSWVTKKDISQATTTFFNQKKIKPFEFNKNSFFSQARTNSISGSCLCFNNSKKLKRILTTDFSKLEHDYQLGIIFSLIGGIRLINDKLIYYRQHENNSLGVQNYSFKDKIYKIIFHQENENLVSEKIVLFEILIQEISDVNKLIVLKKEFFFLKAMMNLNINWRTRTICLFKNIIWLIKTKRLKTGLNYIINGFLKSN